MLVNTLIIRAKHTSSFQTLVIFSLLASMKVLLSSFINTNVKSIQPYRYRYCDWIIPSQKNSHFTNGSLKSLHTPHLTNPQRPYWITNIFSTPHLLFQMGYVEEFYMPKITETHRYLQKLWTLLIESKMYQMKLLQRYENWGLSI